MFSATANRVRSTLQSLTASNNCQSKDLRFLCSGISLSYHQSILALHSPFLSGLLATRACCQCKQAQCGRKEEVVIILDDVDVSTVQLMMEYLYKGQCIVKDRRSLVALKQLSKMLGFTMQISEHSEIKSKEFNVSENGPSIQALSLSSNGLNQDHSDNVKSLSSKEICDEEGPTHNLNGMNRCSVSVKNDNQILLPVKGKRSSSPEENVKKKSRKIVSPDFEAGLNPSDPAEVKKNGRKRKIKSVGSGDRDPNFDSNGEYTCFNPTFKIRPGSKKVTKASTGKPAVPEIQLTFNLGGDQCVSKETIKLNDLSPVVTKTKKKRRGSKPENSSRQECPPSDHASEIDDKNDLTATVGSRIFSETKAADSQRTSSFSVNSLASNSKFPVFLRAVSEKIEALLPPGLDGKHSDMGRRLAHRVISQKTQDNRYCIITQDDVLGEMMDGLDMMEDAGNLSSDGSEGPLIMDLSEQEP